MHIGVITCEILRKEIGAVIRRAGVDRIFFLLTEPNNLALTILTKKVNERFSSEFAEEARTKSKLKLKLNVKEKTIAGIKKEIRVDNINDSVIIRVLELQSHDYPDKLLAEIEASLKTMSSVVDFVILGYGLCGNTAREMERVIENVEVPVVIPRDKTGAILNNCIEIALGKEKVQALLREEIGTFFMTPAGAAIIKEPQVILESSVGIMAGNSKGSAASDTRRIMRIMKNHYQRVVKICYSEADEDDIEYRKTVDKFASTFGLEIKNVRGSSRLVLEALEEGLGI
uniref:DUF1638 domain-containing protein n=1 Tax=Candidatus Methanophaga sp. ANME-1 ERB7 TaxID=2759913 RepID=A0A7G9Z5M7_9EURY|nr:hypothetical protein BJEEAEJC_00003 [Methanosarcinales archaeon ANME-1 ERB7]